MKELFNNYKNSYENFVKFCNMVLNIPRPQFSNVDVEFLKSLAKILLKVKYNSYTISIVDLYCLISELYINGTTLPSFLLCLFNKQNINKIQAKRYYNNKAGRYFRQYAEVMEMWGLLEKEAEKIKINYSVCEEFMTLKIDETESLRSKMMSMDIMDNSCFMSMWNIKNKITEKTIFSYKPAVYILQYIKYINRPVSKFELANLLGVITYESYSANEVFDNAIYIGKQMPNNLSEHQEWFFEYMGWKNQDGKCFEYKKSQAPHFKFNLFLVFMNNFQLIDIVGEKVTLTNYAQKILSETIPPEIVELESYINIALNNYDSDKKLADLILHNIKPSLLYYAAQDKNFIYAMNVRSLKKPIFDKKGKKIRNRLIAELSKIRANYTCQIGGIPPFKDEHGNNYVESHHIIEFNGEDGPDIIDNLLVINPYYHSLIHHAGKKALDDFYNTLRKNNTVSLDTFKKMNDDYHCLEEKHIRALFEKHLITELEYNQLVAYINNTNIVTNI